MSDPLPTLEDFGDLVGAMLDGMITPDDHARIDHAIATSAEHRAAYRRMAAIESAIAWDRRWGATAQHATPAPRSGPLKRAAPWTLAVYSLAAALLLAAAAVAVYLFAFNSRPETRDSKLNPPVATITDTQDLTWSADSERFAPGDEVAPQTLRTESGGMELLLTSGTQINLTGPAELRLDTPMHVSMTRGRARFTCPHDAKGFTVDLPGGVRVVDLGTVFSVRIVDGVADIRVVDGRVSIQTPTTPAGPLILTAGTDARVDALARVSLIATRTTTFASAAAVLTDGREPGFATPDAIADPHGADTVNGWTWYTAAASEHPTLTVPFAGATAALGEQMIRFGNAGLELRSHGFFFGWGGKGIAIALRSLRFADVATGPASADWVAGNEHLRAYYSQDGGATWHTLARGVDFDVAAGSLEVVFVANDGVDSNTLLSSVTIQYPVVASSDDHPSTPLDRGRPISAPPVAKPSP